MAMAAALKGIYENQETKLHNIVLCYLSWGRRFFFFGASLSFFKCKDWWVDLALTLFSTFLCSLLFLDAVSVLSLTQDQLDLICKELTQILVARNQENVGLSVETGGCSDGFELSFREKMLVFDHFRIIGNGRKVYVYFTVCVLFALTAIELYGCKCLLCKGNGHGVGPLLVELWLNFFQF